MALSNINVSGSKLAIAIIGIVVLIVLGYIFLSIANIIPTNNELLKGLKDSFRNSGLLSIVLAIIIIIIVVAVFVYKASYS